MKNQTFNKPLDEWIEEDIVVPSRSIDPKTNQVITTNRIEKMKTMYMDVPKEKYRCKDGEHIFQVVDKNKWVFSCVNCTYSRKVYPTTYKFLEGKLIHLQTGRPV